MPRPCSPTAVGRAASHYATYAGSTLQPVPWQPWHGADPRSIAQPPTPHAAHWPRTSASAPDDPRPQEPRTTARLRLARGAEGRSDRRPHRAKSLRIWLTRRWLRRPRRGQHGLIVCSHYPLEVVERRRRLHAWTPSLWGERAGAAGRASGASSDRRASSLTEPGRMLLISLARQNATQAPKHSSFSFRLPFRRRSFGTTDKSVCDTDRLSVWRHTLRSPGCSRVA